ncbi:MAG: carbon-nitrogen hydrolase family protein [Trueperaceae bacterium]|nr:carbon-nitrogen hydrolase family protein [Trueperaceae bacterium]
MTPFAIAGIQMRVSAVESNIPAMEHKLDLTMSIYPWVQMVVFSELCAFGPLTGHAQPLPGPAEAAFRAMAAKHGVWLVAGSVFERAGDRIYNTASVIDPHGTVIGRYRKMFPFRPYEADVTDGTDFLVFDVPDVGRFGVSICYDMWFAETSRTLAAMGAEVIIHPSLTGTIDREIELTIVRATAAMQQCYIFDINGLGAGGNGRSLICGPEGMIFHQAGTDEEIIPLEVDLERVRRSRTHGLLRLGQPLKSFRDRTVDFDVYAGGRSPYLDALGALEKPDRSDAGVASNLGVLSGDG